MSAESGDTLGAILREGYGWTDAGIIVWSRAGCCCEYCGSSMLSDRHRYRTYHDDHILSKSKYLRMHTEEATKEYGGRDWLLQTGRSYSNIALACARCNTVKNTWDPNGRDPLLPLDVEDLPLDVRTRLVERVRTHLAASIAHDEAELDAARKWALSLGIPVT